MLSAGDLLCGAQIAMNKDGKITDNGRILQKFCAPFPQFKTGTFLCNHKNWNYSKKNMNSTKYKTIPTVVSLAGNAFISSGPAFCVP